MKRFYLRYRTVGPEEPIEIRADAIDEAILIGKKWCSLEAGRRFCGVAEKLVLDRSIFEEKTAVEERERLENFEDLSVKAAQQAVQKGQIPIEEAINREIMGKNRESLLDWLRSKKENPDTQAPF